MSKEEKAGEASPRVQLKDFVAGALEEIVLGVSAAQAALKDTTAVVSPTFVNVNVMTQHTSIAKPEDQLSVVEFDVAVTATAKSSGKAGIGGFISVLGAGFQRGTEAEHVEASRIKFSVRVLLPDGFKVRGT